MIAIHTSSHCKRFSSKNPCHIFKDGKRQSLFSLHLPGVNRCLSYPGLTLLGKHFERNGPTALQPLPQSPENDESIGYKITQVNNFARGIINGQETSILLVTLSNDYKTFVTDHNGHFVTLNPKARNKWNELSKIKKLNYDIKDYRPCTSSTTKHIDAQFLVYETILSNIFVKSKVEIFYQSSILERLNDEFPYLPLFFAILNSFLEHKVQSWNKNNVFKNKFGKPIKCIFVNVKKHFYLSKDPKSLFIEKGGELTPWRL